MVSQFPSFERLQLDFKEQIGSYTNNFKPYSDFNFTSLWSWNIDGESAVCMLNGNLVIRLKDYISDGKIYSFLGNKMVDATMEELLRFCKGEKNYLKLLPEDNFKHDQNLLKKFSLKEDRDQFDYIYDIEKLAKLEGADYHKKRNLVKKFTKDNIFQVRELTIENVKVQADINELFHIWLQKKSKEKSDYENEFKAINNCFLLVNSKNLSGCGIYINDLLVGFIIFEYLQNEYAIIHFEKTDPSFGGISEFILKETAGLLKSKGIKFLNLEQDLGIEGLKKGKENWRQIGFLKKYTKGR